MLSNAHRNPNRNKIIKNATLPIKNGTTKGRSTAIVFINMPINDMLKKNRKRLNVKGFAISNVVLLVNIMSN
jgi:hypothetical protein